MKSLEADEWRYLKKFDVIGLSETWCEEKDRSWIKHKLKEYRIDFKDAIREHKKGRAIGGMILAIRKNIEVIEEESRQTGREIVMKNIKMGRKKWKIIYTYMNKERDRNWEIMEEEGQDLRDKNLMILGDMNARTGIKGGDEEEGGRNSKDKVINAEGKKLIEEQWIYLENWTKFKEGAG
ncbi:hypothetical protein QAD02_017677 [Eretmocerus hayati]|uniref:Uncharacterized protein n=1 Tax=Eretmocerus hayati TaxID=131215 RepID=A0ACC2PJC9_9HYME|nr:hypothetical protein QAD02_017677 [Eretmocerus hayati]